MQLPPPPPVPPTVVLVEPTKYAGYDLRLSGQDGQRRHCHPGGDDRHLPNSKRNGRGDECWTLRALNTFTDTKSVRSIDAELVVDHVCERFGL